jgi:hypothetical protein
MADFGQDYLRSDMPTEEKIQQFNEAVCAVEAAESAYSEALDKYRTSDQFDSEEVDRALLLRDIARLSIECAKLNLDV